MFDVEYPDDPDVLLLRERILIKVDSKQLDGLDGLVPKEDGTSVWFIAISFLEDSTVSPFPKGRLKEADIVLSVNLLKAIDVQHLRSEFLHQQLASILPLDVAFGTSFIEVLVLQGQSVGQQIVRHDREGIISIMR